MEFEYNDEIVNSADKLADRITEGGAYLGKFTAVEGFVNDSGAEGLNFMFDAPGVGTAQFTIYTKSRAGGDTWGLAQLAAIQYLLGIKTRLKSVPGTVKRWVDGEKGRELAEVEGDTFPELCDKLLGIVLQLEKYSTQQGRSAERFNLQGQYDATTKLFASEIKEKKTEPKKLDRLLKGLKVKDSRKASPEESAQPSIGITGDY